MKAFPFYFSVKSERMRTKNIHFDTYLLPYVDKTMIHPLYPYDSSDLLIMFVYGPDFERHMIESTASASMRTMTISIVIYWTLIAIILCAARKKLQLPRNGLISSFIDTMIAFISGGNLLLKYKFEKWFFTVLVIGAFFINALWTGDLLSLAISVPDQKVSTFEQLAEIDPPIFLFYKRKDLSDTTYAMLRFANKYS